MSPTGRGGVASGSSNKISGFLADSTTCSVERKDGLQSVQSSLSPSSRVNAGGCVTASSHPGGFSANTSMVVAQEVYNSINEEIKEKWRMNSQVEERLNEQLNRSSGVDKSEKYGICSNLYVVEQYILSLFEYVKAFYKSELVENVNTAFGFTSQKRLKLIHGYDSYIDAGIESSSLEEFTTLPFVLSEELFIEFEQNIIGNGEEEKDQIIKEFQHIHNKAIFDTFNESLNLFRPYFALGGSPYAWSHHEKNIIFCTATPTNVEKILTNAKTKVIEWASFLCGIINDHEMPQEETKRRERTPKATVAEEGELSGGEGGVTSPLQSLLDADNSLSENEYFAQSREERLSRLLLVEVSRLCARTLTYLDQIFESEYKWQLYEDEKAEVLMELSDLVFEELVEEIVDEIAAARE